MTKVFFTTPNQHWLRTEVAERVVHILRDGRYGVQWRPLTRRPYVNNLHHAVVEFLESKADYWLSCDADNPPMNNPLDLVELDKDILGFPTPIWCFKDKPGERPIYWNAYDYDPSCKAYREHQPHDGLQQVDAIGTGCFLIARRVLNNPTLRKGAFFRRWSDVDGTCELGNDLAFCERARAEGFKVWAHYGYPCRHFSELDLTEVVRAIRRLTEEQNDE
jgi:hypothetical protein